MDGRSIADFLYYSLWIQDDEELKKAAEDCKGAWDLVKEVATDNSSIEPYWRVPDDEQTVQGLLRGAIEQAERQVHLHAVRREAIKATEFFIGQLQRYGQEVSTEMVRDLIVVFEGVTDDFPGPSFPLAW